MGLRNIDDVLHFRTDLSPFLVHLTRAVWEEPREHEKLIHQREVADDPIVTAKTVLATIIEEQRLVPGDNPISDARYAVNTFKLSKSEISAYFAAVSFTETPLAEVHCLLDITRRKVNLEPYGLVFLKERLRGKGVMPVWYLNNVNGTKDAVARALCSLIDSHKEEAKEILPLLAVFGKRLQPPGARSQAWASLVDFTWEREWRWPAALGPFTFAKEDVFVGLCPHDEISYFENMYKPVRFIDPRRPMKWYATSLVESRRRFKLKFSVV